MMILFRRLLVLVALAFWQGGFTFYASVVVPVAQAQLGHTRQGFITRQVTDYLNLSAAVALAAVAWDVAASRDASVWRRRLRWAAWAGMVASLILLLWLHDRLEELLDFDDRLVTDRRAFRVHHVWYLWVSTVQWGLALAYAGLALRAWREEDGARASDPPLSRAAPAGQRSHQPTGPV